MAGPLEGFTAMAGTEPNPVNSVNQTKLRVYRASLWPLGCPFMQEELQGWSWGIPEQPSSAGGDLSSGTVEKWKRIKTRKAPGASALHPGFRHPTKTPRIYFRGSGRQPYIEGVETNSALGWKIVCRFHLTLLSVG